VAVVWMGQELAVPLLPQLELQEALHPRQDAVVVVVVPEVLR